MVRTLGCLQQASCVSSVCMHRFEIKVSDFGLSRLKYEREQQSSRPSLEGTIEYCSPEVSAPPSVACFPVIIEVQAGM